MDWGCLSGDLRTFHRKDTIGGALMKQITRKAYSMGAAVFVYSFCSFGLATTLSPAIASSKPAVSHEGTVKSHLEPGKQPNKTLTLQGRIDLGDPFLDAAGVKLSSNSVVSEVRLNSPGYFANVSRGDKLHSCKTSAAGNLILEIERNGKTYQANINLNSPAQNLHASVPQTDLREKTPPLTADIQSNQNRPFSASTIGEMGASAVAQAGHPNCWFEAAVAAMAATPKGQQLLANMISGNETAGFTVTFADDKVPIQVSEDAPPTGDRAVWASILEAAELLRFPDNDPEFGPTCPAGPKIKRGLQMMTGRNAEYKRLDECSITTLTRIIQSSLAAQNPVIIATKSPQENGHLPQIVTPNHAYSILHFDGSSGIVTMRNPYGTEHARHNSAGTNVNSQDDGLVQMDLPTLQRYGRFISWTQ